MFQTVAAAGAMRIASAYDLLAALKQAGYLKEERDAWWWPRSGSEEVVVGALLTQQTKWENVEASLANLHEAGLLSLDALAHCDTQRLKSLIRPSGFYNTKVPRLQALARHILEDFGGFERFQTDVTREWLLAQKGIGKESADSILCYACYRDAMVVDAYTARLLHALDFTMEGYDEIQAWFVEGLDAAWGRVEALYGTEVSRAYVYARLHGKIVEFAKEHIRGKRVDTAIFG